MVDWIQSLNAKRLQALLNYSEHTRKLSISKTDRKPKPKPKSVFENGGFGFLPTLVKLTANILYENYRENGPKTDRQPTENQKHKTCFQTGGFRFFRRLGLGKKKNHKPMTSICYPISAVS